MQRATLFASYDSDHQVRIAEVCYILRRQADVDVYFYPERRASGRFDQELEKASSESTHFILFVSQRTATSEWQERETNWYLRAKGHQFLLPVIVESVQTLPRWIDKHLERIARPDPSEPNWAASVAQEILQAFRIKPSRLDDLPTELHILYEKEMIEGYLKRDQGALAKLVEKGHPIDWPDVARRAWGHNEPAPNPLSVERYGSPRDNGVRVAVDARIGAASSTGKNNAAHANTLSFPEAGPRKDVMYKQHLRVGILVSGGIAPGINAVLSGIVERHEAYRASWKKAGRDLHQTTITGFKEGFRSLLGKRDSVELRPEHLRNVVGEGGSFLTTSRADELLTKDPVRRGELLEKIATQLNAQNYDILYIVGGEGSMRAAHAIWAVHSRMFRDNPISIVGVPKTMDNDILWVWQSFGFMSAVEKAREVITQIHREVTSNPRLAIVQLFGSASGYVVSHAALGSNVSDLALIPEMQFTMEDVCKYIGERLQERKQTGLPHGLITMAETAIPTDYARFANEDYVGLEESEKRALEDFERNNRRVIGQTPDALRSAGLKIVARVLQYYINNEMGSPPQARARGSVPPTMRYTGETDEYWRNYRVLTNEPRHIVRSTPPSVTDVAFGIRLGTMAVDMAMAGYTDCMVSQWLTEYVVVPLKLVVLGRKTVPREGIFWKTVASKTRQIEVPGLK